MDGTTTTGSFFGTYTVAPGDTVSVRALVTPVAIVSERGLAWRLH
jgi:hypothetical protein